MGLWSWLRGGKPVDPTAGWRREPGLQLELDLGRHRLNGVGLGDSLAGLAALGPAEDRAALRAGELVYRSRGLRLGMSEGRLDSFSVIWASPWEPGFLVFGGRTLLEGRELGLGGATSEQQLCGWFGEPYWRDVDEDERLLFWEWGDCEWQVELSPAGCLRELLVVAEPLLADPRARASYGVTRPWPPARPSRTGGERPD